MRTQGIRGLTLIELLSALCIVWLMAQCCLWGMGGLRQRIKNQLALQAAVGALDRARSLAVIRRRRVAVCMLDSAQACDAQWAGGDLAVFVDANQNRAWDAGEEMIYRQAWPGDGLQLRWSNWRREPLITYQPDGSVVSNGTLYFEDGEGSVVQALVISKPGRARIVSGGS